MQITGNYQIFSNNARYTNHRYQNWRNNSQYSVQNNANCTVQNSNSDQYLKNKTIPIAFTALPKETQLKTSVENILNRSIVFGPKEYKNLSKDDLAKVRSYADFIRQDWGNTVVNEILDLGRILSKRLHEKYPDGFIFVSVGRSLASCAKYLEFQGKDVKYCPASNLRGHLWYDEDFKPEFVKEYKKYLDSIGLTKNFAETTQKPILISDFTYSCEGYTLDGFRRLLSLPEIGIAEGDKVRYTPISGMRAFSEENWIFNYSADPAYKYMRFSDVWFDRFYKMLDYERTKLHCSIPAFDVEGYMRDDYIKKSCNNILNKFYQNGNRFEESFEAKMMNFIIADSQVS